MCFILYITAHSSPSPTLFTSIGSSTLVNVSRESVRSNFRFEKVRPYASSKKSASLKATHHTASTKKPSPWSIVAVASSSSAKQQPNSCRVTAASSSTANQQASGKTLTKMAKPMPSSSSPKEVNGTNPPSSLEEEESPLKPQLLNEQLKSQPQGPMTKNLPVEFTAQKRKGQSSKNRNSNPFLKFLAPSKCIYSFLCFVFKLTANILALHHNIHILVVVFIQLFRQRNFRLKIRLSIRNSLEPKRTCLQNRHPRLYPPMQLCLLLSLSNS